MSFRSALACCLVAAVALAAAGACGGTVAGGEGREGAPRDGGPSATGGRRPIARPGAGGASSSSGGAGTTTGGAAGSRPRTGGTTGRAGAGPGGGGGSPPPACTPPSQVCGGLCTDVSRDTTHCGSCFFSCTAAESCVAGVCRRQDAACLPTETRCPTWGCVDMSTNVFACGGCTTVCLDGERCVDGRCAYGTCLNGGTFCEAPDGGRSACVTNFSSDWRHCGGCHAACGGPYESCDNGRCVPPSCEGYCGGFGLDGSDGSTADCQYVYCVETGCTEVTSDPANCGGCGASCTGSQFFWWDAYQCRRGQCACSPTANPCGPGCSTRFSYCPPPGFTGVELDLCLTLARSAYDRCACNRCLGEVRACARSTECINAMDCSLQNVCVGCSEPFYSCTDARGETNALADALVACMNRGCSAP